MSAEVIINCGEGQDAYQVTLTAKDLRVFQRAKSNPAVNDKKGEALVVAIVALGGILKIERRKDGQRNDGPHGEPCLVMFNDNGTPRAIRHFKDGQLNDGKNGEIAVLQFDHTGDRLIYARRYNEGRRGEKLSRVEMAAYSSRHPRFMRGSGRPSGRHMSL
jgi:hypothetical protein